MNRQTEAGGSPGHVLARAAVFLDLENLLYPHMEAGKLSDGVGLLTAALEILGRRATLVTKVGVCNQRLASTIAMDLSKTGVRVFTHRGGPDAADHELLRRIGQELPRSCGLVVIGSGDHIFAPAVSTLRRSGKRVEVLARSRLIAADLYAAADEYIDFMDCPAVAA